MSGRPKRPADAEADELAGLIREAHGATRDLRQLLRELREVRAAFPAAAHDLLQDLLNAHLEMINDALDRAAEHVQKVIRQQEQATREHYTRMLGEEGRDLILNTCAMVLHLAAPHVTVSSYKDELARVATQHWVTGCSCKGCLLVAGTGAGDVYVVTDPADAPPGSLIIDGRQP